MITPDFSQGEYFLVCDSIAWFEEHFLTRRHKHLLDHISGLYNVNEFSQLRSVLGRLSEKFTRSQIFILNLDDEEETGPPRRRMMELDENLLPLLKRIVLEMRRYQAERVERATAKTHNADLIKKIESELTPFDEFLQLSWLHEVTPSQLPRPSDFLSVQAIVASQGDVQRQPREYDEKFHILQAPRLILEDLRYYRHVCATRDAPVTVAYLDIDDFKRLNSKYGEVEVDRRILPRFMQILEEHVFEHGFAYRHGGDEYAMIVPNLDAALAINFFDIVRRRVSDLIYADIEENTTISIGVCSVTSDCFLTDREILERANQAKNFAKSNGKNCIANYSDSGLTHLRIASG
jgi:diguanylate cyclase (GGDEF)-like protein